MKPHYTVDEVPWWLWVLIAVILLVQGTWLFLDARKRGKYPWFWGIWGFTGTPTPLLCYLLFVVKPWRKNRDWNHPDR
ncbi:MAG: sigmaY antisigma factor component [Paenibacillus dendritiformis]|uniref:sigmaY antisigma factor component n=1 Tax=Paenibacillus dendritiformis TaxID=130049 RepID=UPI00143DF5AE|nr:sigmaY antisigma factor component [Paenibacillus dendritiformis]MDU5144375.1 sigmaY antisigma factor component [Paenibacillus dendritiformis]NKI20525.1 sigmaY antisigma factor component [Paenibacillus dendritiformis]NRF98782.1 sigmaY antisigma factor component [Paenibacillus dendritiformis]